MKSSKLVWLMTCAGVPAFASDEASPLVGLDVAVEGAAGLGPEEVRNTALHGNALVHAAWNPAPEEGAAPLWSAYVSAMAFAGDGPCGKFVGDLNALSNLEADKGVRLYSWWLEANPGAFSLRGGALLIDEEFAGTDSGGALFNSGFGWPGFISANTVNTGPAFFIPALGLRARWKTESGFQVQAAFCDGDSWDSPEGDSHGNRHGLHFELNGEQSYFGMAEVAYAPPGTPVGLKAGYWRHGGDFADTYFDAAGGSYTLNGTAPLQHSGNAGAYVIVTAGFEKPFGLPGRWDHHVRYGWAAKNRNAVSDAFDCGWAWSGVIPGRDDDALALGFLQTQLSAPHTRALAEADTAAARLDYEQVWEIGYHWQINETYSFHPDFQLIRNPGGDPSRESAKVLLARFTASF